MHKNAASISTISINSIIIVDKIFITFADIIYWYNICM